MYIYLLLCFFFSNSKIRSSILKRLSAHNLFAYVKIDQIFFIFFFI